MGDHTRQTDANEEYDDSKKTFEEIKQEPSEFQDVTKLDMHENFNELWLKIPKNEDITAAAKSLCEVGYGNNPNEQLTVKLEDSMWCVSYSDGHREDNGTDIMAENINSKNENIENGDVEVNTKTHEENENAQGFDVGNRDDSDVKWYQCSLCDYKTKRRYYLVAHFRGKHDETAEWHKCELCAYKTKVKHYLTGHVWKVHRKIQRFGSFHCRHCDFESNDRYYFSRHVVRMHANVKWHYCHICEYKTKHKDGLQSHFRFKHADNIEYHQCEFCESKFKTKSNLNRHIDCKHKENPQLLECRLCKFTTKYSFRLTQHIKAIHTVTTDFLECKLCQFQMKEDCHSEADHNDGAESLGLNLSAIERPLVRCHHTTDSHHCHHCDFKTNRADYLKRHVRTMHENVVWYHCNVCLYKSKHKACLQSHFISMHDDNIEYIQCELCEYKTKNKYNLKKHLGWKHNVNH